MSSGDQSPPGQPRRAGHVAAELRGHPERDHLGPLGGQGLLHGPVGAAQRHPQRLPAPAVVHLVGGVDRLVAGGVGVAAELVGAVLVAVLDHRLGGRGPDLGRRRGVGPVDAVAQLLHLEGEVLLAGGEQVDQAGVGGEADRLVLVLQGVLLHRPPQLVAVAGADRPGVVGRPGVEHGGVGHADGPGGHGRAGAARVGPDRLEQLLVPAQDHVVALGRGEPVDRVQRRREVGVGRPGGLRPAHSPGPEAGQQQRGHHDRRQPAPRPHPHASSPYPAAKPPATAPEHTASARQGKSRRSGRSTQAPGRAQPWPGPAGWKRSPSPSATARPSPASLARWARTDSSAAGCRAGSTAA